MTKGGKLKITEEMIREKDREMLMIKISDTGIGINEEDIENIFNPFFTTKKDKGGTGLGLWIVKREIESHCGEITVKSKSGKGTEFQIILSKFNFT